MNFTYGVIAAVGALVALSLAMIAVDPGHMVDPDLNAAGEPVMEPEPAPPEPVFVSLPEDSSLPECKSDNTCFIPYEVSVGVGDTVTWTNDDVAAHTVTSGTLSVGPDGIFDSGLFISGATFEFEFEEPGTYDYFCIVHPWMLGKVHVS